MQFKTVALAAALALVGGASAHAQFANMDINALNARMNAQMNAAMNQRTNGIVSQNVNDPRIVAAWRANPRGMSLQQYAYMWGATGGFTPQGMAYFNANEANNRANEQAALARYRQAQGNFAAAVQGRNDAHFANMQESGRGLMGQQSYFNPATGQVIPLSYLNAAQPTVVGGWRYVPVGNGRWIASNGAQTININPMAPSPR